MNILIAEDNEKMRRMLKNFLYRNLTGISAIYECENGREAVLKYQKYSPDWTLLDIKMDLMDGLSAARIIKTKNPAAKIIFITSYDEKGYRDEAKRISVYAYILKENINELAAILKNVSPS